VIEARNLTRRYGPTVAVDALSFDVRAGSVTGFLGPNGSGKSTTMRLILGLDRPDAGPTPARRGSAVAATASCAGRCARSARCSTPGRSTGAVAPAVT
jgi:ABC-type Na+ transport system ATPase subunit NatA